MKFNIAAFTDTGNVRISNQDRVLVGSLVLSSGFYMIGDTDGAICFVADGIGGRHGGDFAAQFVTERLLQRAGRIEPSDNESLDRFLHNVNQKLIQVGSSEPERRGCGTTLVGFVSDGVNFCFTNAGDSESWLHRDELFLRVSEPQVLDDSQENSPITSYFGGMKDSLNIAHSKVVRELRDGDIVVLCSDGLTKAVPLRKIKSVLSESENMEQSAGILHDLALENHANDNVSCILIKVIEDKVQSSVEAEDLNRTVSDTDQMQNGGDE